MYLFFADGNTVWPDSNLGPLAPKDKRFPLPGSVGPSRQILGSTPFPLLPRQEPVNPEDLFQQLSEERQKTVMDNLETTVNEVSNSEKRNLYSYYLCPSTLNEVTNVEIKKSRILIIDGSPARPTIF